VGLAILAYFIGVILWEMLMKFPSWIKEQWKYSKERFDKDGNYL